MPAISEGDLILVTGANGYVASVTIQTFLARGYRVRGTVRDVSKHQWMLSHYGPNLSLVAVPEMSVPGAFDDAVRGVDGIAHVASRVFFDPDPHKAIPPVIQSAIGLLEAATKEPSVKCVVYTSSSGACMTPIPGKKYHIDSSTYNEGSKAAWTLPMSQDMPRMMLNYLCSKTEAEQACFKWVKENKPHYTFNTVVPSANFGIMVAPEHTGFPSSIGLLKLLWRGSTAPVRMLPPSWYVDVEDTALLHLAALTLPGVENERVFGIAEKFCYNDILAIFKKVCPGRKFLEHVDEVPDIGTVETIARSEELLKRVGKAEGFSTLEEGVSKWITWMLKVEDEGLEVPETEADRLEKMGV